jgi:hypothetical protein
MDRAHAHFINLTCTEVSPYCPVQDTIYGYRPSLAFNAFFLAFFASLALVHAYLGIRGRTYFFAHMLTLGCISEALGYAGRVMMWQNAFNATAFNLQISCLIFAPSFVAAGVYITLKQIVLTFGKRTSILPPALYTWIFMSCDTACLTLQAVGGGFAGSAGDDAAKRDLGTNLMISGIVLQVATLVAFMFLVVVYIVRTKHAWHAVPSDAQALKSNTRFRAFATGLTIATLAIFTRCVYRIPELSGGWGSPIMEDQTGFIVLEGL